MTLSAEGLRENRRKAYLAVGAAVLIQTLLGSVYAWSVFVPALRELSGLTSAQTQTVFGGMIAVFTLTMVPAGRLLERVGPRRIAIAGGLFYGGGYVAASFSGAHFLPLFLSISVLSGIGIGCGYVCALTTCLRWFPQRKGFITGLAVAGFGGGSIMVSTSVGLLLNSGLPVLKIFWLLGLLFGGAIILAGLLLEFPPSKPRINETALASKGMTFGRTPIFWIAAIGIFAGTFAGLLIIGNLKPIGLAAGLELPVAIAAISAFAVGNAAGRILWGCVYDRLGFFVLPVSLASLGLLILLLIPAAVSKFLFLAVAVAVGIGFGSCFVLYAALIATHFGAERVGIIYPWVFLFYGGAALLGPLAGGWLFDLTGSFASSILIASCVAWGAAGILAASSLGPATKNFAGVAARFGKTRLS